ncbi:hypothetical protein Pmani_021860 [Petrolisthes manimaculis]|uniref:Eukaryotic peptide chain release factor subunit 1 n=1 Tax=Petrolisthes manimaculis TaxID=1843537 RepID=A0AAE1PD78_9EUCA|nr:hypothetical protein Pmani_021860 [Petrolisthes manimaculis]
MDASNGTSMITLIMPPKDQIARANKLLAEEYSAASNIKSRVNFPNNGLVIYCGTIVTEEGKEKRMTIDFEPFKPINTSMYRCDNRFHTDALSALLTDDNVIGFIVVDGNGALFGTLQGNTKDVLHKFSVSLPNKHRRGGQSALRFARLRMEQRNNFLRKVAELAGQLFISNDKANVVGMVLAGMADLKNELTQSSYFDPRLQAKVIKVVDVSYGGEKGFNEAINLSAESLINVKFIQEKNLIAHFFEEISIDTGKYCYGVDETLRALTCGAVETIICWENLNITRFVLRNNHNGVETVIHLNPKQMNDKTHFTDKESGVDLELLESMSWLEWLANNYKSFGATLQIITDRSPEGYQFVMSFGGIGGLLRYKLDLQQLSDVDELFEDLDIEDYL